jgi:hypothetical protein
MQRHQMPQQNQFNAIVDQDKITYVKGNFPN